MFFFNPLEVDARVLPLPSRCSAGLRGYWKVLEVWDREHEAMREKTMG